MKSKLSDWDILTVLHLKRFSILFICSADEQVITKQQALCEGVFLIKPTSDWSVLRSRWVWKQSQRLIQPLMDCSHLFRKFSESVSPVEARRSSFSFESYALCNPRHIQIKLMIFTFSFMMWLHCRTAASSSGYCSLQAEITHLFLISN